jgi:hypothetical protein
MKKTSLLIAISFLPGIVIADARVSGVIGTEFRLFTEEATQGQDDASVSVYAEPEWYWRWDDSSITVKPFIRIDSMDDERTHLDIREAYWETVGDEWSFNIGINKVFWGVAETQHLVDIINQTDQVESVDGEDKLGQPMIQFKLEKEWGTLGFILLPGFRERTFAGVDGRLRLEIPVDTDNALYESSAKDKHTDFAIRFTKTIDAWDIGLAHFVGTSRDPLFVFDNQSFKLVPYYPQITQTSIDAQATLEDWLLKFEMIYRTDFGENYFAAVTGFEYSTYGIFDTDKDLGWILEYQYDQRDSVGTGAFQVDVSDVVVLGARLAFNDTQSTEFLFGLGFETDNDAQFFSIEGSRRIGDDMKLNIEGRIFTGIDDDALLDTFFYSFRKDDFIQATLDWYF